MNKETEIVLHGADAKFERSVVSSNKEMRKSLTLLG